MSLGTLEGLSPGSPDAAIPLALPYNGTQGADVRTGTAGYGGSAPPRRSCARRTSKSSSLRRLACRVISAFTRVFDALCAGMSGRDARAARNQTLAPAVMSADRPPEPRHG